MDQWLQSPVIVTPIVSVVSLAGAFIGVVWALGGWKGSVEQRLKPLDGFAEWKGSVDEKLEALSKLLDEVRVILFRELPKATVSRSSPTHLNDLGKTIAAELKAREWAAQLIPVLKGRVEGKAPHEVDRFALDYVYGVILVTGEDKAMVERASECAYNHGLGLDHVLAVLQVVLRNALLAAPGSVPED